MKKNQNTVQQIKKNTRQQKKGVAEGSKQVYNVLAVDKSNALSKKVKLKVKANSLDEVFEQLAISDWYPLKINGVEVINGERLKQGVKEEFNPELANTLRLAGIKTASLDEDGRGGSDVSNWRGGWKDVKTPSGSPIRTASGSTVKSRDWSADTPKADTAPARGLTLKPIMPTMRAPDYKDQPLDVVDYYGDVKDPKSSVLVRPLAPREPIDATPLDDTSPDSKKGPNYTISSPSASWRMDGKTGTTTAGSWEHEFDDKGQRVRSVMPSEPDNPDFDINQEIDRSLPSIDDLLDRNPQESINTELTDILRLAGRKNK